MKPEDAAEFRKMFTLRELTPEEKAEFKKSPLAQPHPKFDGTAKPANHVDRVIGTTSNKIQFTVDMTKCKWR